MATAHFGSFITTEKIMSRQGFSSPRSRQGLSCCDRVLRLSARPDLGMRDRHACPVKMRTQKSFWALCRDRVLHVATWFLGLLGGLCRARDFPCKTRENLNFSEKG